MYIMIFEDGTMWKSTEFSADDMEAVESGVLDVIDITDPQHPKTYFQGAWHEIDEPKELNSPSD